MISHDPNALQKALDYYRDLTSPTSILKVADQFGVPYATLYARLKKNQNSEVKLGRKPYLTKDDETILLRWIAKAVLAGLPPTKSQIQDYVRCYLNKVLDKNAAVTESWFKGFATRHLELVMRRAQFVTKANSSVSEREIRDWFK